MKVNDRRRIERQHLADNQSADMDIPRGWRSSIPSPSPSASGIAPSSVAIVVIMIGAKGRLDRLRLGLESTMAFKVNRHVDHHNRVLCHDTDKEKSHQ